MSSAEADEAFCLPAVEEARDGEARFADVGGEVFHLDDEFRFAFAVGKDGGEEVSQPSFCFFLSGGEECRFALLGTGREGVEQVEAKDFALHQVATKQGLPYAQHLDFGLCAVCMPVGRLEAEEAVHFDGGRGFQQGARGVDAIA